MKLLPRWIRVLILCAAVLAAHGRALKSGFVNFDDPNVVVQNPVITSPDADNIRAVFGEVRDHAWLPLYYASFWVDSALFGLNPAGFHGINVLLHLVNTLLLWLLLERLCGARGAAWFAALLFAVHPALVESVGWISSRKDLLSFAFFALSILSFQRGLESGLRRHLILGPSLAFSAGMMSKATIFGLVFILGAMAWVHADRQRMSAERQRVVRNALFLLGVLSLLWVGLHLSISLNQGTSSVIDEQTFAARSIDMAGVFARYVRLLCLPIELNVFHDVPFNNLIDLRDVEGLILIVVGLAGVAVSLRRGWIVAVTLVWFFAGLLPFNNVVPRFSVALAERYLYLPAAGFFASLALVTRHISLFSRPWTGWTGGALVILLLAALSFDRHGVWRNSETLWRDAVQKSPEAMLPRLQLGHALEERAQGSSSAASGELLREARELYFEGLTRARGVREQTQARLKLVGVLVLSGRYHEAVQTFEILDTVLKAEGIRLADSDREVLAITRASALVALRRFDEAEQRLAQVNSLGPNGPDAEDARIAIQVLRGRSWLSGDDPMVSELEGAKSITQALDDYRRLLARYPERRKTLVDYLKTLIFAAWIPDHAILVANELGKASRRFPDDPAFWVLRAQVNREDDPAGAAADIDRAIRADPQREDYYIILADILRTAGKNKDATHVLMKGIKEIPDSERLNLELANTYLAFAYHHQNTKNPHLALEAAERAVGLNPKLAEGFALLGELHEYFAARPEGEPVVKQDHWEKARICFEKALMIEPKTPRHLQGMARYFKAAGYGAGIELSRLNREKASAEDRARAHERQREFFRRAIELAPDYDALGVVKDWLRSQGEVFLNEATRRLGEHDEPAAREALRNAALYGVDRSDYHTLLARVEFEAGRFDQARAAHERALELDAENLESLYELGKLRAAAGEWSSARDLLTSFVNKSAAQDVAEDLEAFVQTARELIKRCEEHLKP